MSSHAVRLEDRAQDDEDDEAGQREQGVDDAHHDRVDDPADVAGDRAPQRADEGADERDGQPTSSELCPPSMRRPTMS